MRRPLLAIISIVLMSLLALSARQLPKLNLYPAKSYPAHDEHADESVTMAADPYDTPEKAAVFAVDYRQYEYLPIRLIISNDSGEPIQLANSRIQLVTRNKTKIEPSTPDDLYRRLGKTSRRGDSPRVALPIPQGPKVGVGKNVKQEIETFRFQAKAVEPHSIQAGFLFFNVSDIDNPLSGAHLYITDVRNNSGADLLYFDVALDEYLAHQSAQAAPRSAPK